MHSATTEDHLNTYFDQGIQAFEAERVLISSRKISKATESR